jgi:hypothetical protein
MVGKYQTLESVLSWLMPVKPAIRPPANSIISAHVAVGFVSQSCTSETDSYGILPMLPLGSFGKNGYPTGLPRLLIYFAIGFVSPSSKCLSE